MEDIREAIKQVLRDEMLFVEHLSGLRLRQYQVQVATAIIKSVSQNLGLSFVVLFPRQSGKNELQAQIETYFLTMYMQTEAEIVKVSPTWKPQTLNAMRRLQRVLEKNVITCDRWTKESGYIYKVGTARIFFLSGSPTTNIVGATASTLLECDEAQDVLQSKWDKDINPMAASTNATRVFWGTAWTSRTLLARELRTARELEKQDGKKRVFVLTADDVAREVPAYGKFVAEQVARLGRNHPMVRTQYFSEEVDAEGGMFPLARRALMQGDHARLLRPADENLYALLLDVAGEDEGRSGSNSAVTEDGSGENLENPMRDSTALTVVEVDLSSLADELIQAPSYRVVNRYSWIGVKHTSLYGQIKALAEHWQARYLVVDATSVGAGLASFLEKALPNKVIPFIFTAKSKSDLGWGFLAVIETGRYKEYGTENGRHGDTGNDLQQNMRLIWPSLQADLQSVFFNQLENCINTVLDGPGKLMRWGVPDGTRDPGTGELVHDDLILSAALCSVLDQQAWGLGRSEVAASYDPLGDLREVF